MVIRAPVNPLISGSWLAWHSTNTQLNKIGPKTAEQVGTGEVLYDPESGFRVDFPKGKKEIVFDLQVCREVAEDDSSVREDSYLAPALGHNGPHYVIKEETLEALMERPPWEISELEETLPDEDVHRMVTKRALTGAKILFYEDEPEPVETFAREVSYSDTHPAVDGVGISWTDYLPIMFRPDRVNGRHGQMALIWDRTIRRRRLQTHAETVAGIRGGLDQLLTEAYELDAERREAPPTSTFLKDSEMYRIYDEIRGMEKALSEGRLSDVVAQMLRLRHSFFYPRMRDIDSLKEPLDPQSVKSALEPFSVFAGLVEGAIAFLTLDKPEKGMLSSGYENLRNIARFIPEEQRRSVLGGREWLTALGQKTMPDATHQAQDPFAHCHRWRKDKSGKDLDVCDEYVTANPCGIRSKTGALHSSENDEATIDRGWFKNLLVFFGILDAEEKPTLQKAVLITREINDLMKMDRNTFEWSKEKLLDHYFPPEEAIGKPLLDPVSKTP